MQNRTLEDTQSCHLSQGKDSPSEPVKRAKLNVTGKDWPAGPCTLNVDSENSLWRRGEEF